MVKCSFCSHENDDGLPFCEKCKTDLTVPVPEMVATAEALAGDPPAAWSGTTGGDTEVPTLHLDKVPLVENLGARAGASGEMTRPSMPRGPHGPMAPAVAPINLGDNGVAEPTSDHSALENDAQAIKPRLVVLRGEKIDMQYPLYAGKNYLGRTDDKPVDIDLENQEPADRIWTSRQHAVITMEAGLLTIEDLNSLNGTFVNRTRVHPGQVRTLQANDIIQVGTVQLRLILS